MKHFRIKTRLFRRAALSLLTLVMAFTTQKAWADHGWYDASMSIGGITTNMFEWSNNPESPTDLGIVSNMTVTSIAFKIWSDANDRGGANMYFRIWDGGSSQVGDDQDIWLGEATRIAGDHDFAISWTDNLDLASAVGLTLEPGKTYYIDMWAKTYGNSGDEWYSNGGANYHSKLTIASNGNCGTSGHESDVTWSLTTGGALTISGTGAMKNYGDTDEVPWNSNKSSITSVVIESGVTTIGDFAFSECANLASVSIPASVTSIGHNAFYESANLTSISIPASVTSIGSYVFYGCTNLATVTLNSNPYIDYDAFPNNAIVTMNLTANPAGGANWMTFYNENYSFEADANTQVFKVTLSGDQLTMHEVEDKIVDNSTAVVLKSSDSPVMTLTSLSSTNEDGNSLTGTSTEIKTTGPNNYYVLNYKEATGVGFYKLSNVSGTIGANKAYLTYGAGAREFFLFDDDATGISTTLNDNVEMTDDNVYDLLGRRVQNPTKGLYIVNGKKVIIK